MHYFIIFFKIFNQQCVNFLRDWTKNTNCWEILRKMQKKIEFLIILENFLLKIEPSEIIPFFYNIFSVGGWGGGFPPSPWL